MEQIWQDVYHLSLKLLILTVSVNQRNPWCVKEFLASSFAVLHFVKMDPPEFFRTPLAVPSCLSPRHFILQEEGVSHRCGGPPLLLKVKKFVFTLNPMPRRSWNIIVFGQLSVGS
jgi:hypothetical protein